MSRCLLILIGLWLSLSVHAVDDSTTVLVVRHRWHTGIAFPADRLSPALAFLSPHYTSPRYFEFGWGDDAFYRRDNSIGLMLRAMLWPTHSVMHVAGLDRHPEALPHGEIQALCLSPEQLRSLQEDIARDFVLNEDGTPAEVSSGLYGDSHFFPAKGTFWLGRTCNTWTAHKLEAAGIAMKRLTLSAGGVLAQLEEQASCAPAGEGEHHRPRPLAPAPE